MEHAGVSAATKLAEIILFVKRYVDDSICRSDFDRLFPLLWFEFAPTLQATFPIIAELPESIADVVLTTEPHFSDEQHRRIAATLFRKFVNRCVEIGIAL